MLSCERGCFPIFVRVLGQGTATTRPSSYDGWVQVHDPMLRAIPSAKLDGTSLSRTWILHESWRPTLPRLVGGVRADDGWLGCTRYSRASSPPVPQPSLSKERAEKCRSPASVTTPGRFRLRTSPANSRSSRPLDGSDYHRTTRFYTAPASEAFKPPSDPEAWIVEEIDGTGTMASSIPFRTAPPEDDCERLCERVAYLGPDVGTFVDDPGQAAWRVTRFAGRLLGSRGPLRGQAALPSNQVVSAHARRRWRKMLFESAPWLDPDFDNDRRRVKARASAHAHLPRLELEQLVPDLGAMGLATPSDCHGPSRPNPLRPRIDAIGNRLA